MLTVKLREERNDLKMEAELKNSENSQPIHNAKIRKPVWKRTPMV